MNNFEDEQGHQRITGNPIYVGSIIINKLWINLQILRLSVSVLTFWIPWKFLYSKRYLFSCWIIYSFPQLPYLNSYDSYCSNQVAAKALLDHKKQDHRVQDFLQRCLESPFSRKLDLWHFLDIPRSRLVKYPLLLREILRHTPNDHPDQQHLEEAVSCWIFLIIVF